MQHFICSLAPWRHNKWVRRELCININESVTRHNTSVANIGYLLLKFKGSRHKSEKQRDTLGAISNRCISKIVISLCCIKSIKLMHQNASAICFTSKVFNSIGITFSSIGYPKGWHVICNSRLGTLPIARNIFYSLETK